MRTPSARVAIVPAAVLAILLAGCTSDKSTDGRERKPASSTSSTVRDHNSGTADAQTDDGGATTSTAPSQGAGLVDARRAAEIALAEVPGSVVVEVDEHRGGKVQQWEVVVLNSDGTGTELRIDMATGEVISRTPEGLDQEERSAPAISAQTAMETALAAAPGEIVEVDLDSESGRTVWDVEVRTPTGARQELTIDATTGEIIRQGTG